MIKPEKLQQLVIVIRKMHTLCVLPIAVICVGVIWLLRGIVLVRVGGIALDRIGGGYPALWYLSELRAGKFNKKCFDLFYHYPYSGVCNKQWFVMLKRRMIFLWCKKLADIVFKLFGMFNMHKHMITYPHPPENETLSCVFSNNTPLIEFTEEEEQRGRQLLEQLGVRKGSRFICFHSRDAAYLSVNFSQMDWKYHDYRDTKIDNYLKAAEKITEHEYYAIRMGAVVDQKINTSNPRIIDYANSSLRSDFLDIYLSAKCRYFLGSDCGITIMAEAFKRPLIYTNWVSICMLSTYYHDALVIMKKWYSKKNRFITYCPLTL